MIKQVNHVTIFKSFIFKSNKTNKYNDIKVAVFDH